MWYDYQRFGMIIDVTTIHKTPDDVNVTTNNRSCYNHKQNPNGIFSYTRLQLDKM